MSNNYIVKIGKCYRYRRRVPSEVSHLDKREEVKISLKTKDRKTAEIRASIYNDQIENFWKSLIHSDDSHSFEGKYLATVQLAKAHGFAYKTSEQVAASALSEITERLSKIDENSFGKSHKTTTQALLGGVDQPMIPLCECWDIFEKLVHDRLANKTKDQIRKWKNVRKLALKNFVQVTTAEYLDQVDRTEILKFWEWLNIRVKDGLKANTANKQISFLKDILRTISSKKQVDLDIGILFAETFFKQTPNSRLPFEASFVQKKILPAAHQLKERDRYGLLAIADTGMRQSELFGLAPNDIFLLEAIPYIWIRPREGYSLKTLDSERKIPLVGTALKAFEKFPNGLNHLGNAEVFSAAINEFLTTNRLRPTNAHTAYSLRHTFKDRLRDYGETGAPEEIIDELMGHKKPGVHYGRGHKLETKHKILKKIAYQ